MKLTKYKHACLTIEKDGKVLVIDPGNLSDDFITPENVVAVVVTHQHPDHLDESRLAEIVNNNNQVIVLGPTDVIEKVTVTSKKIVKTGDTIQIGPFSLEFFGEKHEVFHSSLPLVDNVGVMVNDTLYYPGDSYVNPNKPVDTLALPLSGPWLKTGDAIDFALAVKPKMAFSTHDAHLSDEGKALVDTYVPMLIEKTGIKYMRIIDAIDIDG